MKELQLHDSIEVGVIVDGYGDVKFSGTIVRIGYIDGKIVSIEFVALDGLDVTYGERV